MIVAIALSPDGSAGQGWGRAPRVAAARVEGGRVETWENVVAGHMGPPMVHMLERMEIGVRLGVDGDARAAAVAASRPPPPTG